VKFEDAEEIYVDKEVTGVLPYKFEPYAPDETDLGVAESTDGDIGN
jgi:hypothetical protein